MRMCSTVAAFEALAANERSLLSLLSVRANRSMMSVLDHAKQGCVSRVPGVLGESSAAVSAALRHSAICIRRSSLSASI
jgi:hypothetical protein